MNSYQRDFKHTQNGGKVRYTLPQHVKTKRVQILTAFKIMLLTLIRG